MSATTMTRDELRARWGLADCCERTFVRTIRRLGLRPIFGRGRRMVFRIAEVLRAEECGKGAGR